MNAVIDQGNTLYKLAVFQGDAVLYSTSSKDLCAALSLLASEFPLIKQGIVSSVGNSAQNEAPLSASAIQWIHFTSSTPVPIHNLYGTPHTLGLDRIAAAVGASVLFPGQNVLVVDAGTAITYEYISAQGEYLGGNISPGMFMRFRALHTFTEKLPLLDPGAPSLPYGNDTASAMKIGVENGIIHEINGTIEHFNAQFPNGCIIITGGDALFFEKKLKCRIFAQPDLVLIGLNNILNYNIENTLS